MRTLLLSLALLLTWSLAACGADDSSVSTEGGDDGADAEESTVDGDPATTAEEKEEEADEDESSTETTTANEAGDSGSSTGDGTEDASGGSDGADNEGTDPSSGGSGTIAVRLEEVDGMFVEGFEVGLRIESEDGTTLASTLWSDMVEAEGTDSIDAYYTSVYEAEVPAGGAVVLATVNVGMGPPPETPDLAGDLDCQLPVEVPEDGRVEVEVNFSGRNCLSLIES